MSFAAFDPGALLARFYPLAQGPSVCLRLTRPRDREGIGRLFHRHGREIDELELARLVRCDPRQRISMCATALIGAAETVLGVAALDLDEPADGTDGFVLADDEVAEGLAELLTEALHGRARGLTGRGAATAA